MKKIRYLLNWYDTNGGGASFLKYEAGSDYELNDESERHVLQGHAVYVEAQEPDQAAATAPDPVAIEQQSAAAPDPDAIEQQSAAAPDPAAV